MFFTVLGRRLDQWSVRAPRFGNYYIQCILETVRFGATSERNKRMHTPEWSTGGPDRFSHVTWLASNENTWMRKPQLEYSSFHSTKVSRLFLFRIWLLFFSGINPHIHSAQTMRDDRRTLFWWLWTVNHDIGVYDFP